MTQNPKVQEVEQAAAQVKRRAKAPADRSTELLLQEADVTNAGISTVISVLVDKRSLSTKTRAVRAETDSGWSRNWSKSAAFLSMNTETTVALRLPKIDTYRALRS